MDPKKIAYEKMQAALAANEAIFAKADAEQRPVTAEELAEVGKNEAIVVSSKADSDAAVQA